MRKDIIGTFIAFFFPLVFSGMAYHDHGLKGFFSVLVITGLCAAFGMGGGQIMDERD